MSEKITCRYPGRNQAVVEICSLLENPIPGSSVRFIAASPRSAGK